MYRSYLCILIVGLVAFKFSYAENDSNEVTPCVVDPCPPKSYCLPIHYAGWFGGAEFLYWKVDESGLDFAVFKRNSLPPPIIPSFPPGTEFGIDGLVGDLQQVNFDYSPGFRVQAGYRFPRDCIELSGIYTYYQVTANNSVTNPELVPGVNPLSFEGIPTLTPTLPSLIGILKTATSHATINYNIVDVLFSKAIPMGCSWIKFLAGPTGAFIDHHWSVEFMNNPIGIATVPFKEPHNFDWSFNGGGIKLGLDSHWNLGCGFNVLLGGAFSALYGNYENNITTFVNFVGMPEGYQSGYADQLHYERGRTVYTSQVKGGLAWNRPFCRLNLELYINYELNIWFNLNEQMRVNYFAANGEDDQPFKPDQPKVRELQTPTFNLQGLSVGCVLNF